MVIVMSWRVWLHVIGSLVVCIISTEEPELIVVIVDRLVVGLCIVIMCWGDGNALDASRVHGESTEVHWQGIHANWEAQKCVLCAVSYQTILSPVGFVACWAVKITCLLTDLLYTDHVIVTLLSSIVAILYFRTKLFDWLTILVVQVEQVVPLCLCVHTITSEQCDFWHRYLICWFTLPLSEGQGFRSEFMVTGESMRLKWSVQPWGRVF